jgi:hypothetical protein
MSVANNGKNKGNTRINMAPLLENKAARNEEMAARLGYTAINMAPLLANKSNRSLAAIRPRTALNTISENENENVNDNERSMANKSSPQTTRSVVRKTRKSRKSRKTNNANKTRKSRKSRK